MRRQFITAASKLSLDHTKTDEEFQAEEEDSFSFPHHPRWVQSSPKLPLN